MFMLRLFGMFNQAMAACNHKVAMKGLPAYHLGGRNFNTEYKTDVRFVASLPPRFVILLDHIPTERSLEVEVF